MRLNAFVIFIAALLAPPAPKTQPNRFVGDWKDPDGSVIRIDRCSNNLCLRIASVSDSAPATTDIHNPDPGKKGRALCGLEIGSGFSLPDPEHAIGGTIYDPRSGKTYHAGMTIQGAKLVLRGYVGIPVFGRSEAWTRTNPPVKTCKAIQ